MSGKIIFVNGASSSGKSTLSRALQAKLEEPFWHFSIDHLREARVLPMQRIQSGDFAWSALRPAFFEGFHRCLPALVAAGNNLIVEHIVETEVWMHRLVQLLEPFDVFFVGVHCPLPELERREKERGDRIIGEARQDYEIAHTFGIYDIEVNSTEPLERNVDTVISAWKTRKRPSAFDKMASVQSLQVQNHRNPAFTPGKLHFIMTSTNVIRPTLDTELNAVLHELVTSTQAILGANFLATYLQGSFAVGDWDSHSDVDFLVAIDHAVSERDLAALQTMHARIYDLDSNWAKHLDGSYFPKEILRHDDPSSAPLLYLDNGSRELIWSAHDNTRVVRWVTREYGIPLAGPDSHTLIDLVSEEDLRQEVLATMQEWGQQLFANPDHADNRWYQPFVVLSYCRMLHTLHTGRIGSKPAGAQWAMSTLDSRWTDLIQRAWEERPHPSLKVRQKADVDDLQRTLDFIQYALAASRQ